MSQPAGTVIHVVEDLGVGGIERAVQRWTLAARAAGFDARVVCTRRGGPVADELKEAGAPVEVLHEANFLSLSRALKGRKPFVVHSHGAARTIARLAGRLAGASGIIHHLHGTERYGAKQTLFERAVPADLYLACSGFSAESFRAQVGGVPVEVLYNSVDTERFRFSEESRRRGRADLGVDDEIPVVLVVGRFVPDKGQDVLIAAAPKILAEHRDVVIVFAGDGPTRPAAEALSKRFGAAVRFLGVRRDVAPLLSACDIYVQPSLHREAMPVAVVEALACGRPVVGSEVEGVPEVVGDAGLLVAPGDSDALAAAVLRLLGDPARRERMGTRGRERAVSEFSSAVTDPRLFAHYRRLLGAA